MHKLGSDQRTSEGGLLDLGGISEFRFSRMRRPRSARGRRMIWIQKKLKGCHPIGWS